MIIQTRYRDIDFDEAAKCVRGPASPSKWAALRGTPVGFSTPPIAEPQWKFVVCDGPFYELYPPEYDGDYRAMACVHIAEIGD